MQDATAMDRLVLSLLLQARGFSTAHDTFDRDVLCAELRTDAFFKLAGDVDRATAIQTPSGPMTFADLRVATIAQLLLIEHHGHTTPFTAREIAQIRTGAENVLNARRTRHASTLCRTANN